MFLVNPFGFPSSLRSILVGLGLTTNLQLCLDAGDIESYDGTSQTWKDRSGNGYDFVRGNTTSSETSDPTFHGTAGGISSGEYFSFDGGDWFTLGQSNPTWIEALHKDNAKFSIIGWTNKGLNVGDVGAVNGGQGIILAGDTATSTHPALYVFTPSSTPLQASATTLTFPNTGNWTCEEMSFDEAAGNLIFGIDGVTETLTGKTYSSPPTTGASNTLQIGAQGGGIAPYGNGYHISMFAMWNRALTATEMTDLHTATKGRFGL